MRNEELELAKQEFSRDRNLWTDLLLQRRFYYADLLTRLVDRQINHTLTLTTLAVAILSIVFPIVNKAFYLATTSFTLLSISALLGTGLVLYTIFHDKKGIPKIRDEELKVYSKFQSSANQNYSKAYDKSLIWEDVKQYFNLKKEVVRDLSKTKGHKIQDITIDIFYILFLVSFFLGLVSFLISVFCYS